MKIKLTTLAPLLVATGESSAHIDADVKYDRYGLPYISGKTFKGLLRESCLEVCEISGRADTDEVIKDLFGTRGGSSDGLLKFNNFRIESYHDCVWCLRNDKSISPKFVQTYFTAIRKQTSLEDDGTAKNKSLRIYRYIKTGETFESTIENADNKHKDILDKAILNLRYIGTRRNRGFGKVKIEQTTLPTRESIPDTPGETAGTTSAASGNYKLSYTISLKAPLLISKQIGDQNTAATEEFIPAQTIRGLVAGLAIKSSNYQQPAHREGEFKKLVLDASIKYTNAFVKVNDQQYTPAPLALGFIKTEPKGQRKAYNILKNDHPAKPIKGWYRINGENNFEKREVDTLFSFHSSRKSERIAGTSKEGSGAIFYFESIEENQTFAGSISGDAENLTKIRNLLMQHDGTHRIGRSKTAQYSQVQFTGFELSEDDRTGKKTKNDGQFYIVFQSPVIVHNEYGMAIPNIENLQQALEGEHIKILKIAASNTFAEGFMGVWKSKINRESAFAMGTTLLVEATLPVDIAGLERKGIGERVAEGFGAIVVMEIADEYPAIVQNHMDNAVLPPANKVNDVYENIKAAFKKRENKNNIKAAAIEKSSKHRLKNSLVYRLKDELDNAENLDAWQKFLEGIVDKKAGNSIKENHLWESLYNLAGPSDWADQNLYWKTFFDALRVKSKKGNSHGE